MPFHKDIGLRSGVDICMIVTSNKDITYIAHVQRHAKSLARHGWVIVIVHVTEAPTRQAATTDEGEFEVRHVASGFLGNLSLGKLGKIVRTAIAYLKAARELRQINADAYQAKDFTGLTIAALAGIWHRPVVYDATELYFDRPVATLTRRLSPLLRMIEKLLARRAARVIVTSSGHANALEKNLGIVSPTVVHNAAELRTLPERTEVSSIGADSIVAHSGWLLNGRCLSELVGALAILPERVSIVLIGDGPLRNQLEMQAAACGVSNRLTVTGSVKPDQILELLQRATLAVVLITSAHRSYQLALPNKFFEAIAAGLPLVVSPIPELKRLVEQYDIGVVCDPHDPKSIAKAILMVADPDNLSRMRVNVRRARDEMNWEVEEQKLIALYTEVFNHTFRRG